MYDPKGNSRAKLEELVDFNETEPPRHLAGTVHRFLEVKTRETLPEDYRFHALPDACVYVVLDQRNRDIAGVTRLRASAVELNLGRDFHFINIRFLPGVWQRDRVAVGLGLIDAPYNGDLPLIELNAAPTTERLSRFVEDLRQQGVVRPNVVTERIFARLEDMFSVADMADAAGLSPRQLQRVLKQTTGLAPHDFLKVLRLQQSLAGTPSLAYADQSHFIHSFKKATGYTPGQYARKYDV